MKKIVLIALVVVLSLVVMGCGGASPNDQDDSVFGNHEEFMAPLQTDEQAYQGEKPAEKVFAEIPEDVEGEFELNLDNALKELEMVE